ncbi:glycosyltransferase family 4 protein [Halomonas sp. McH1-25]|uniref:glycosyltransferase family 4 protein n=1 Tax=unclassified Halomonas TaxID=2609666 RepID=UPI001EF6B687|nr:MULTISPECIES: glycosyltransferase family 4 protein [unclassified Halomonas]MCG7601052.1 glycosyltransferase family 4 protein [Halomonas sp. McH1-25]MCP1344188.1 glycosyltransferase family 4 protein [Halomonas sp. FL8]MCP1361216.1 glycosyltransferase family 4 protein [Halomonas sp. BBD45]
MPKLTFIVAGDPAQLTGSHVYDARVVAALREQGWQIDVIGLDGRFPEPDTRATQALESALAAQPEGASVIIDGMAMGGLPEVVAKHATRLDITALVHHPLADETGLDDAQRTRFTISETRALAAANRVIATSPFTARRLADFEVPAEQVFVVEPGVEPAPLAASVERPSAGRQRLLCVATLTPRKGHDVLVDALAQLSEFDWQCECVGGLKHDPRHAEAIAARIRDKGLEDRIHLVGERAAEALSESYDQADLFVLPSHYEGYGMVIAEAVSRGLPVITTTGGALAYTLPRGAGIGVVPGDSQALAESLRQWFTDATLRERLRQGARQARSSLRSWSDIGRAFATALASPPRRHHPD